MQELARREDRSLEPRRSGALARRGEETIDFDDAVLLFRNFAGKESQYNRAGDRNFAVAIDEEMAERYRAQGLNPKPLKRREEDTETTYILKVKVKFGHRPPNIYLISSKGKTRIPEDLADMMDFVSPERVELVASVYNYEFGGRKGKTLYLRTMGFWIYEDNLERKYASIPDLGAAIDREELEASQSPGDGFDGDIIDGEFY